MMILTLRRVDVFGELTLKKHRKSEDLDQQTLNQLVNVAQSAFNKEGQPTYDDVVEHIVPSNTFITAEIDGEIAGFSSTDQLADTTYAVGLAVHEDFQGNGIGKLARTYGVLQEMDENDIIATRTQNPVVLDYMQELFDAFPKEGEKTPNYISESLEDLAYELSPEAEFDNRSHVVSEAYPASMYDEVPDNELKQFTDQLLDYESGDALLVGGEAAKEEVLESYARLKNSRSYGVQEI